MPAFVGFDCYGGATITRVVDGAGAEWIGCTARNLTINTFGFYCFKNGVNIPLAPFCTGRGSINQDGHWIAWDKNIYHTGALPGFTPVVGVAGAAPVPIPPGGALASLYTGVYVAADFDTPAETALRFQKLLDAVQEMEALLKQAGVLA